MSTSLRSNAPLERSARTLRSNAPLERSARTLRLILALNGHKTTYAQCIFWPIFVKQILSFLTSQDN
jgi:hypothetical protein